MFDHLPMVKKHIMDVMPHAGYKMVSERLKNKGFALTNGAVFKEIQQIKKENNNNVTLECCLFLQDQGIELDSYCNDFIKSEGKSV